MAESPQLLRLSERDPCDDCDGSCGDVCPVMEAKRADLEREIERRAVAALEEANDQANGALKLLAEVEREVERLRQGLWDCAIAAGMDHDGDLTPQHCATDVVEVALREVCQLSRDYDEALGGGLA